LSPGIAECYRRAPREPLPIPAGGVSVTAVTLHAMLDAFNEQWGDRAPVAAAEV
jgi:hypothetical protein